MGALRQHVAHYRLHMVGCGVGSLALIAGIVVHAPILALAGAIVCAASCLDMVRTMFARHRREGEAPFAKPRH